MLTDNVDNLVIVIKFTQLSWSKVIKLSGFYYIIIFCNSRKEANLT